MFSGLAARRPLPDAPPVVERSLLARPLEPLMPNDLATMCPCGHAAHFHPSQAQLDVRWRETRGQWGKECAGGLYPSPACRCQTSREQVIAAGKEV